MADENDKSKDEDFDEIVGTDDTDWQTETYKLREKAIRQREKTKATRDALKAAEAELAEFKKAKSEEKKSDEGLLKRLDTMALKVAGITADDEVELFNKWKEETGRDADSVVGNKIFQAELADLRTTKANAAATADIKGEGGASSAKNTVEYWLNKATKGDDGKLRFPEETPKELYGQIVAKLGEKEPGASKGKLEFYNQ